MKYYAVKIGKVPGIYNSWDDCKEQVIGFQNAVYKSFSSIEDANNFLTNKKVNVSSNVPVAYVDGSYKEETDEYSFGCVLLLDGKEYTFNKKFPSDEYSSMRNVIGEIMGAGFIIKYLLNRGFNEVDLYYDYVGIESWYTKSWKANTDGTKKYVEFADSVRNKIKVNFHKVKGHSNDKYNDLADRLAKDALGIK